MRKTVSILLALLLCAVPVSAERKEIPVVAKALASTMLIPMVTNEDDAALVAALEQPNVGGLCFIITWKAIEPTEGVYKFNKIEHVLSLCQAYGKQMQLMVYTGKWAPSWVQPKFTCYFKGQAADTYASWNGVADAALDGLFAALGQQFDGRLSLVYSSGGSILNGVEMCLVVQDTWTAKYALIQQGYSVAGYKAALERQIDRVARTFPNTHKMFMLHYQVHNDATNSMYVGLAQYAQSRGVLCNVGFLQADTDNSVFAGRSGGVASCTRAAWNMRGPGWGLVSWSPKDVNGTIGAAQALGAEWLAMFYEDAVR